jgi:hypothetical protein
LARSISEDAACSYPIGHDEEDLHGENSTPLPPLSVPILSNGKQSH